MTREFIAQPAGTVAMLKRGSGLYPEPSPDEATTVGTTGTKALVRVLLTTKADKWAVIEYAGKVSFVLSDNLTDYAQEIPLEDALSQVTRILLKKVIAELPALLPTEKPTEK